MKHTTPEDRAWDIVRELNEHMPVLGKKPTTRLLTSTEARGLLTEYFRICHPTPSRLHSAILSCGVRMAMVYPDFRFVPFLTMWGFENLRPEDSETRRTKDGTRFPSLAEHMARAYAYSLLFHPSLHLTETEEAVIMPILTLKGFHTTTSGLVTPLLATRLFEAEVRGRKMTFVALISPEGEEIVTEVHTLTTYVKMHYELIVGKLFDTLLRKSEQGKLRIEAAYPSQSSAAQLFTTAIGYVDRIDAGHRHIHVFDNLSRHLVAPYISSKPPYLEGQYVRFLPIIPREGNFKTAVILEVLADGPGTFGYRPAVITHVDPDKDYATWQLLPESDGQVRGITEAGTTLPPATSGYLRGTLARQKGLSLPTRDTRIEIIAFLQRSKDGKKYPKVVDYRILTSGEAT